MTAVADRLRAAPRGEMVSLVLLLGTVVASIVWHPADDGGFVLCPFRKATGLPCPGCGLTRSFCAVAKGHVERGFEFHALGPVLFFAVCVYAVRSAGAVGGANVGRFDAWVQRWRLVRVGLAAMIIAWIVELVRLGMAGQLGVLLRQGSLTRWFV